MQKIVDGLKVYKPIGNVVIPHSIGFYAFYTLIEDCFEDTELQGVKQYDCIYIGIAKDETLHDRIVNSHLKSAGKSTFRRSLSAILRDKLDLTPMMRGVTPTRSNISNYRFSEQDELKLTRFMKNNLGIAYYPYSQEGLEVIEKEIIKEFGYPAFNLEYAKQAENPYFLCIKQARKECRNIVTSQVRG